MKIEIFGTGCQKCEKLAANAEAAAKKLGIDFELTKITNLSEIMKRGVIMTPGLAIDGTVKLSGKVASESEIESLLKDMR